MDDDFDEDIPERFRPLLKALPGEVELRKKLYPDVSVVEDKKIQCTICLKNVQHIFFLKKKSYKHIFLQVVVCKSCMKFYGDGDFSTEEDGDDKYCRWCGQGGKLYLCSKCPTAFCKKCIKQNLERKFVLRIEDDDWLCFVCDPEPLYKLRALSWAIDEHLENEKKKDEAAQSKKVATPKTPKARTVKIPKIEFSDDNFRHNVDSTRLFFKSLAEKLPQIFSVQSFTNLERDIDKLTTVSDLESVVSTWMASMDAKIDEIVDFKSQLAVGVQKLIDTIAERENTCGNSTKNDNANKKKLDKSKKSLVVIDDSDDSSSTNKTNSSSRNKKSDGALSDRKNKTSSRKELVLDNNSNDSNSASSAKEQPDRAQKTDNASDRISSGEETIDGDATIAALPDSNADLNDSCVDMFEEDTKPMIRLRNMSELIDPKLNSQTSSEKPKSKFKAQEKQKSRPEPEEVTVISSDDDEPPPKTSDSKKKAKSGRAVSKKTDLPSKDMLKTLKKKTNGIATSTPKVALKANVTSDSSDEEVLVPNPKARKLSLATKDSKRTSERTELEIEDENCRAASLSPLENSFASKKTEEQKSEGDSDHPGPTSPGSPDSQHSTASNKLSDTVKDSTEKQGAFFSDSDDGSGPSDDEGTKKSTSQSKKDVEDKNQKRGAETAKKCDEGDAKSSLKARKTVPKKVDNHKVSSSTSSSSDPLSDGSSDVAKKKSAGKKKSVAKVDSDGSSEPKNKKKIRRSKKAANVSDSDSEDDGRELWRKKKKPVKKEKTNKPKGEANEKTNTKRPRDDGSASDYDISRLCNLKSLQSKCTVSGSSDEEEQEEEEEEEEEKKSTHKDKKQKTKTAEEKLSDFFDSADDQLSENKEDLEAFYQREFAHISANNATQNDILAEILKMSSQSEDEGKPSSDEEEEPEATKNSKKSDPDKLDKPKSKKENAATSKGKKQYPDKLMKMKVDSTDSEDFEAGQEKYDKHKQKQAQKKQESSEDDTPVIKKKLPPKGKKKVNKKMFSDSDDSPIEDVKSENESEKAAEEEAAESDDSDNKKRKKSSSDSDSSSAAKKKKRKRIRAATDSDESETDSDGGGRRRKKKDPNESKGRKSIRKILKEDDLKRTTQEALKAEQERKKRIKEKQELYNKMLVKASDTEAPKELSELVLDFDPKTKEKILCVDTDLVKKLKPHQAEGIKFMWDCCFETVKMAKKKSGSGCILAHCMGLGKSLQVVTLVHTLITNPDIGVRKVLVVAPLSTVLNWVNEFDKWLSDIGTGQDVNVYHMNKVQTAHRTYLLKDWDRNGGVLIMGYNLLRNLSNAKARFKAAAKKVFQENLVDPGPDVVICDEGHILKNEKTAVNQCMTQIKTRRRIVLTGTPLQNNLVEYHCMVQFVKPNLLGTKKEFTNRFVNPIMNGQFEDSTQHDVKVMKRRAHVLHTMLDGIVQRKDYSVLTPYLPPKFEYVIHLKLSEVQVKLYRYYLLHMVHGGNTDADAAPKGRRLFLDFQNLMWICLHPRTLLMKADKDEVKKAMMDESDEEGSLKDFIDDEKSTSESDFKTSGSSDDNSGSEASVKSVENNGRRGRRKTRALGSPSEPEDDPTPVKQWWSDLIEESHMDSIHASSKLFLFFTILKYCEEIGDKLLIFSQSLYTLDILEYFLDKIDIETQNPEEERCPGIKGFEGSWAKGLDYFRLDGSSACENREAWCKSFNRPDNPRARLFLISTRAGGLGINLTGANRVIIFDASWNPSFDVQSLFRVYRFGQEKPCYIYRFLSKGTMEEKIYERQVAKLSTSLRVIDEQQIDRHFSHSALNELYMFDPEGSELQGTPALPKDRLMAELLQNHKDIILSHHQHDSLLENQEDQELSEEERKAAWQEFENEKNQKPPPPAFNLNAMANLMVEIRTKLQMQNPTWTEEQLKLASLQLMQRLPDFPQMAPYITFILQQQQAQQQFAQRPMAQYSGMQFPPPFRYPLYNNNAAGSMPMVNSMAGKSMGTNMGIGTSMGVGANMGIGTNMGIGSNMMGNNMAAGNMGMLSQLLNSAGAGTSAANPISSLLSSMAPNPSSMNASKLAPNPKHAQKTSGAGTSTDPITLNDSGPIEIE